MPTAVVTGASRGIGLELARQLSARGTRVIAGVRDPAGSAELSALDVRVEALDVSDSESVAAFAARLGDEPVDLLINNAGRYGGKSPLGQLDFANFEKTFGVNSLGPLRVTEMLLPNLRAGTAKRVVQITSKMGSIDDNASGGSYGYRASKAALHVINKSLAVDLREDGVVCVVLHPGWVQTDMGGRAAPLSVVESVEGMLRVIDRLSPSDSGRFFDYQGEEIPW